jgi:hypothetical protein
MAFRRRIVILLAVAAGWAFVLSPVPAAAQATESIKTRATKSGKLRVALFPVDPSRNGAVTKPIIAAAFEDAMLKAGRFVTLSRSERGAVQAEQRFAASGAVDPASAVKLGKSLSSNYVVIVRQLTMDSKSSMDKAATFLGIGKTTITYNVSLQAQAIDVETSEIVQSTSFSRNFETSKVVKDHRSPGAPEPINEPYRKVLDEFANAFASQLAAAIPLDALVVAIRDANNIAINAGSEAGLRVGARFELIDEGAAIKDPSGTILGYDSRTLGTAELVRLEAKLSWLKLLTTVSPSGVPDMAPDVAKVKQYTLVKLVSGTK